MAVTSPEFKSTLKSVFYTYWDKCSVSMADGSLTRYKYALSSFDHFLDSINYDGSDITEDMLFEWKKEISHLSDGSISTYETAVRQALLAARAFGINSQMPSSSGKTRDGYQPYIYSDSELSMIVAFADNMQPIQPYPWCHYEIPMVLRILIGCGTRITETLELQMKDVDLENGIMVMRRTKGKKERLVPVTEDLRQMLGAYCKAMNVTKTPNAYLFPGRDESEPLNHTYFAQHFRSLLKLAGISNDHLQRYARGACVHCIRHTFGCNSLRQLNRLGLHEADYIPYLSTYMGHRDIDETQKYLKFTAEMVSEESEQFEDSIQTIYDCPVFRDDTDWDA